jgi:putative ABC transport system ATP-binding protein
MQISLKNVLPNPLMEVFLYNPQAATSQIWQNDVQFEKEQKYLVKAPSGKGKSTFIHLLYGLRQDFRGTILLDKSDVRKIRPTDWAHLRQSYLAIVFQDLRLFSNLTAEENILIKAFLHKKKDYKPEIKQMAERLGVAGLLQKSASVLSYGERQRIAIIRALVQPFEFILLDEPFSHLDEANITEACKLFNEKCAENNAGMIMTSLGYDYPIVFQHNLIL